MIVLGVGKTIISKLENKYVLVDEYQLRSSFGGVIVVITIVLGVAKTITIKF